MKRFQPSKEDDSQPDLNITPLIDVVFVILIGFILIAPLLEMDRIELANGGKGTREVEASNAMPLQITVKRDNTLVYRDMEVSLEELRELLALEKEQHPDEKPKLLHDKYAHFGTYQEIKNMLASLGFEELDIILNPSCKP